MLQNIRRSTRNIVVGYLKSISAGGDGAEFVYTFVVEALKVGRVGVDEVRRLHPSLSRQCQQWQGRRSWLKARLVVMVADVVGNEMPSCGACLGNGCGGTGGAPTCDV
jgi:hypothetical protein